MPNRMPAADVEVTTELVRRLLADQHPDLAGRPVEFLANGWDNAMFRLGDELVVRLPRRQVAAQNLVNEQRWLPALAPAIHLPIPAPERTGLPAHGYPFRWSVVPYLPGDPAAEAGPRLDLASAAVSLGRFLGELHAPAPPEAPANPVRGVPLADRANAFEANLAQLDDIRGPADRADGAGKPDPDGQAANADDEADGSDQANRVDRAAVRRAWAAALAAAPYAGPPRWLHGDLHPANILVRDGRISAVIDFGDITAGDPATDLAVAWMLLPTERHPAFRAAYRTAGNRPADATDAATADDGPAGTALWDRARGWALSLAIVFLAYSADNPQLRAVGRRTLDRVLQP